MLAGSPARKPRTADAPGPPRGLSRLLRRGPAARGSAALAACALLAAACSPAAGPPPARRSAAAGARTPQSRPAAAPADRVLQVTPAAFQLPSGISREVVFSRGGSLLIAGGLTQRGTSAAALTRVNPVTGQAVRAGSLTAPTHDAAGAMVGGRPFLFGGGDQGPVPAVQALRPGGRATVAGRLPGSRSDLAAVDIGRTTYVLGGFDGARYDRSVLATTDGSSFRTVARLPVPVRYAAVAAVGRQIWVFGGQAAGGITDAIQRVTPATGAATIAGRLPHPVTGAAAITLGGKIYLAGGQVAAGARGPVAGPAAALATSAAVRGFDPARGTLTAAGHLPVPVAYAAAAVLGRTGFLIGGADGKQVVPAVTVLRLVTPAAAVPSASGAGTAAAPAHAAGREGIAPAAAGTPPAGQPRTHRLTGAASPFLTSAPWLRPARGHGHLAPGSDPGALPGDIMIADNWNNRLLIVDPQGRIRWRFPRPGDLSRRQTFKLPDDAFFSRDGRFIIATEEEDSVISVISIARHRIVYRYGTPGVPGSADNQLSNPDDAMMMPGGGLITADIKNCRLLLLRPPARHPRRVIGQTGVCAHDPPQAFGSPNGAFPATNGDYIVSEITGDWATQLSLNGHVRWSVHPPGVAYPSDTNEIYPGRYLTADYSAAGQVVEFSSRGRLLWRFGGLNHPSLALPLPNGDLLVNDDDNDRVIVIDPAAHRIVWQYGHTGVPGSRPGYLNDPDGVDLAPPDSMLIAHGATMGKP